MEKKTTNQEELDPKATPENVQKAGYGNRKLPDDQTKSDNNSETTNS